MHIKQIIHNIAMEEKCNQPKPEKYTYQIMAMYYLLSIMA